MRQNNHRQHYKLLGAGCIIFLLWFIPWVFVLHLGLLFYFPYHSDGSSRFLRVTGPIAGLFTQSLWTRSENIPETCKEAAIGGEDTLFYEHLGIDLDGIMKSFKKNMKKNKIVAGGSTITQQIVKNAFYSRNKNYVRKARETIGALILDRIMSKDTQMTWYLNIVEFGPEIYGISNAAHFYFKKLPEKLTISQCIALAVILPSPKKWGVSLLKKNHSQFFRHRYKIILERMWILDLISEEEYEQAERIIL